MCGTPRIGDRVKPPIKTVAAETPYISSYPSEAKDIQEGGTHYKDMEIEPWDVIDTWPIEQQIGYHRGNLLKYTMRMGRKDNDIQEIEKAGHYARKLKEVMDRARKENRTKGI
jgi:hypothetical protein